MTDDTKPQEKPARSATPAPVVNQGEDKTAAQPETQAPASVEDIVQDWVAQHIYNSPLSRETPAWNHLNKVLPRLIERLKEGQ